MILNGKMVVCEETNFRLQTKHIYMYMNVYAIAYSGTPLMQTLLGPSSSVLIIGVSSFQGLDFDHL